MPEGAHRCVAELPGRGWRIGMIAVTGGTGLTGRFVLERLAGRKVRCLVRPTSDLAGMPDGLEFVLGDCRDVSSLGPLVRGASVVVHIAGISTSANVVEACRAYEVDRLIVIGSTGIYSKHRTGIDLRLSWEDGVRSSGLRYTLIRPTMIYGNQRDGNIKRLFQVVKKYPVIPVFGGEVLLQPIYAGDLASAIVAAVFNDVAVGKEYNVAGRTPIRYRGILRLIAEALEKRRVFVDVPYPVAMLGGYIGELTHSRLISREKVMRLLEDRVFDYSEATRDLGFKPLSFRPGVMLEADALVEAGVV